MKGTRAAIRYAKAVLNLAIETNQAEEVNNDMQLIASTIDGAKDLQIAIDSPVIKSEVKKQTFLAHLLRIFLKV